MNRGIHDRGTEGEEMIIESMKKGVGDEGDDDNDDDDERTGREGRYLLRCRGRLIVWCTQKGGRLGWEDSSCVHT